MGPVYRIMQILCCKETQLVLINGTQHAHNCCQCLAIPPHWSAWSLLATMHSFLCCLLCCFYCCRRHGSLQASWRHMSWPSEGTVAGTQQHRTRCFQYRQQDAKPLPLLKRMHPLTAARVWLCSSSCSCGVEAPASICPSSFLRSSTKTA